MSALTIPAIKDTKLTLKVLDSLNVDPERILLLLNRSDAHSDFNKDAVEQNLRFPISLQLPHDPKIVAASVNRGAPSVSTNPAGEISRAVRELVTRLVPLEHSAAAAAVAVGAGATSADRKRGKRFGFGKG